LACPLVHDRAQPQRGAGRDRDASGGQLLGTPAWCSTPPHDHDFSNSGGGSAPGTPRGAPRRPESCHDSLSTLGALWDWWVPILLPRQDGVHSWRPPPLSVPDPRFLLGPGSHWGPWQPVPSTPWCAPLLWLGSLGSWCATSPPPPRLPSPPSNDTEGDGAGGVKLPGPTLQPAPSLRDLIVEEHEVTARRRRVRRKRAVDSASRIHRSRRLAAKEHPFYEDATSKATRVQAAKLDLSRASARLKEAIEESEVLQRPPPPRVTRRHLLCLGRACGLSNLSEVEEDAPLDA